MNEELQNALTELINKSMELGGTALDFAQGQLPDVVQQLLMWELVANIVPFTIGLIFLGISAYFLIKRLAWRPQSPADQGEMINMLVELSANNQKKFSIRYHADNLIDALEGVRHEKEEAPDELYGLAAVAFATAVLLTSLSFDWVQIWLAPKVYLLEYATHLAK